jgi:hypothetical protein
MAGIAIAESGGNTHALNNTPATGDYSVGLWQINYFQNLRPSRTQRYGSPEELLADPNKQARAAINLFGNNGVGIGNWTNDATWNAWVRAGRPQAPDAATVTSWIGANRGTIGDTVPTPGALPPVSPGGVTTEALNNPTRAAGTCNPGGGLQIPVSISITGVKTVNIFTGCQVKGLIGGLCVGFGAGIMLTGMVVIATRSKTAQQAIGVASGVATGGASRVAGVARGVQSSRVERRAAQDDEYYESLPEASAPVPRNRRQANRQAEDVFDRLGVSRPLGATADEPF